MNATHTGNRRHRIITAFGVLLVAAGCTSRPSLGPQTETGQPAHVDGGPGQLLRYCETLHDRGKLAMAAAMCERAYQIDPTNPETLLELASVLGEMGEMELAKQAYNTILRDLPGHADAHYGLGRIYLGASEYDLALAQFQAGLRSDPKDPRLYNAAGVASGMLGAHAAAQDAFRAGLKVAPNDVRLRNNLGLSLIQSGHYDEGLKLLQAVAKDPAAEKTNRENLDMALSVAAAARAEAVIAEARARDKAESMAQADTQDQASPVADPVPMAPDDPTHGSGAAEMSPEAQPSASVAGTDAPQVAAQMPAEETTPTDPKRTADEDPPRPIISWARPDRSAVADGSDRAAGDRPDEVQLASSAQDPANREAEATAEPDAGAMDEAVDQTGEEAGDDRLADDPAPADDETIAEAMDDAAAEPIEDSAAETRDAAMAEQMAARSGAMATAGSGDHAVQFASYTSEDRAWRGWSALQADAADILGNVQPTVRQARLGGTQGLVYRLRTTPGPKAEAQRLCDDLKPRGIACLVVKVEAQSDEQDAPKGAATL